MKKKSLSAKKIIHKLLLNHLKNKKINKIFKKFKNYLEKNGIVTRPVMAGNFVEQPVINLIPHKISGNLKNSTEIMENAFLIGNHQNVDETLRKYVSEIIIRFLKSKLK